jgi:hypothetical protein
MGLSPIDAQTGERRLDLSSVLWISPFTSMR